MEPFNPFLSEFRADPYPFYHRLHDDPVHWGVSPLPALAGSWYISRYSDVAATLKDQRFGHKRRRKAPATVTLAPSDKYKFFLQMSDQMILFRNPPDHTRLRSLVNRAFTPHIVEQLRPKIVEITNNLLDRVQPAAEMNVIADLAMPLPATIIAEMLGIRSEDRARFYEWTRAIVAAVDARENIAIYAPAAQAGRELIEYLREISVERARNPKDDLITNLLQAEEEGEKLSETELFAMCILLLVAGDETTLNLIGNGVLTLLRHPDQLDALQRNPDLIESAVEECLRYESPVQCISRFACEDVQVHGQKIRSGDAVMLLLGAANRDPEVFTDPDWFDIRRFARDHRHVASFGFGIHFCLGATLARAEAQLAIATLLRRMPNLRLKSKAADWRDSFNFRGLNSLPVSF